MTHDFTNILMRSGLPHLRFHDLRHSCASFLLKRGVHPLAVMELLGHSQINLTLNTYSYVLPSVHKETAAAMDRVPSGEYVVDPSLRVRPALTHGPVASDGMSVKTYP